MKCERCGKEMEKRSAVVNLGSTIKIETPLGYADRDKYLFAKSIYICYECGKIELNINE